MNKRAKNMVNHSSQSTVIFKTEQLIKMNNSKVIVQKTY